MRMLLLTLLLVLIGLGIAHFVRAHIRRTREELEHVDRSKLRDLSQDEWDRDEDSR
ncbi:hypothetical protein [Spectribacter hydrogenoxidans]|uniref:Uncharacterized protein n=1 Tax=Spectribacter hydrogenoxidans TaxID=3075608 RepID=A0ABU3BZV8_9GAMM|nr:hypothetical protein [Salinisphaera sp. W335]MDT0634805.1 hypothetical protein [Salinisphaera sp. W335]